MNGEQPACRTPLWGERSAGFSIVLAAVALRLAWPSHMAVEHFDEGVYASNFWFTAEEGYRYPDLHLYAPPLLPWLVESFLVIQKLIMGSTGSACMFINPLVGGMTVWLVWRMARRWFGVVAGLTAAVLAAASDFHILLSRTVLTDVLHGFWLLLAVFCFWSSCRTLRLRWSIAAGVATGLGWATKYSGWLPLAICISGLTAWLVFQRPGIRTAGRSFLSWAVMATVAVVVWSPVWLGLQSVGGYEAVASNHRQYMVGTSGWTASFVQQASNIQHFDGWLTAGGLAMAVVVPTLASRWIDVASRSGSDSTWNRDQAAHHDAGASSSSQQSAKRSLTSDSKSVGTNLALFGGGIALLLIAVTTLCGSAIVLAALAIVGIGCQLMSKHDTDESAAPAADRKLAAWLLAAWFIGLLATTPLYRPYPRLALPWLMSAWLGTAAAVGCCSQRLPQRARRTLQNSLPRFGGEGRVRGPRERRHSPHPHHGTRLAFAAASAIVCVTSIAFSGNRISARGVPGWQDRSGLAVIAGTIADDALAAALADGRDTTDGILVYVYAEPGVFYHLSTRGVLAGPVTSLNFVDDKTTRRLPTFLVTGPHADRSAKFHQQWDTGWDRFQLIARYRYVPSDLVLLDEHEPHKLDAPREELVEEVRLYAVR